MFVILLFAFFIFKWSVRFSLLCVVYISCFFYIVLFVMKMMKEKEDLRTRAVFSSCKAKLVLEFLVLKIKRKYILSFKLQHNSCFYIYVIFIKRFGEWGMVPLMWHFFCFLFFYFFIFKI